MISFLIYWLLAERFSSGKRFRQDFYPHSAFSSFSCFKNTFLRTFSSGQIGTFSSPWENGLHFGTSLLPGRMVYILELLFSLGEKSSTRRIWRDFPKFFILSSLIKTLFSLGEWFTFWNFSSPWENGSVFQLASIFLPKSVGFLSKSTYGDT